MLYANPAIADRMSPAEFDAERQVILERRRHLYLSEQARKEQLFRAELECERLERLKASNERELAQIVAESAALERRYRRGIEHELAAFHIDEAL